MLLRFNWALVFFHRFVKQAISRAYANRSKSCFYHFSFTDNCPINDLSIFLHGRNSLVLDFILQEIVPLRKVCRRPETDYRLQQLHAVNEAASAEQQKSSTDAFAVAGLRSSIPAETIQKQHNIDAAVAAPSPAPASVLEPKKSEIVNIAEAGNPTNIPLVANAISIGSSTSINLLVSGENMPEGKT